jgi:sugar phosphate isomerase/epimerase
MRLAVLNVMTGTDIAESVRRQRDLGLLDVDLKSDIFGKRITDLTDGEAGKVRTLVEDNGMSVYCLSTELFGDWIERGEADFRRAQLGPVARTVELVGILRPRMVRLLAPQQGERPAGVTLGDHLAQRAPWLLEQFREATRLLRATGVAVTVENEVHGCILANPDDVLSFFAALDVPDEIGFTWDIQNMWALGTAPSLEIYRQLRPLICYVHLKGGRAGIDGALRWRSPLRQATWPVREVLSEVVKDGVSPVICLNPSHGVTPPGYDRAAEVDDDLRFVREILHDREEPPRRDAEERGVPE